MSDVERIVGGFRSSIQDLLVPELKALQVEVRGLPERMDTIDRRLDKHDEKFEKIFITLEKHNERFEPILDSLTHLEKTQQVILNRLNYADKISEMQVEIERLKHQLNLVSSEKERVS